MHDTDRSVGDGIIGHAIIGLTITKIAYQVNESKIRWMQITFDNGSSCEIWPDGPCCESPYLGVIYA